MPWKYNVGDTVKVAYPTYEHQQLGYDGLTGEVKAGPDRLLGRYTVECPTGGVTHEGAPYFVSDYFLPFELETVDG